MEPAIKKIGDFKSHSHLLSSQNHICEFYPSAETRIRSLCNFIVPGIIKDEAVVVIATAENILHLKNNLILYAIDVTEVEKSGQLIFLDAEKTLARFMRYDFLDDMLFFNYFSTIMDPLEKEYNGIRAYGEMIDVLCKTKSFHHTMELERLWSDLSLRYRFSLLCGYSAENFNNRHDQMKRICQMHTHLISKGILEFI